MFKLATQKLATEGAESHAKPEDKSFEYHKTFKHLHYKLTFLPLGCPDLLSCDLVHSICTHDHGNLSKYNEGEPALACVKFRHAQLRTCPTAVVALRVSRH